MVYEGLLRTHIKKAHNNHGSVNVAHDLNYMGHWFEPLGNIGNWFW